MDFSDWRERSPFYNETHDALAKAVRRFVEKEAAPYIDEWEAGGEVPRDLHKKAGLAGILGIGFPEEYGGVSEGVDIFHHLVKVDELARLGAGGFTAGLVAHNAALPPIIALGSEELKKRVAPPVISGERIMAIAVTEPSGGSDVASLKTRAEKRGDRYVVNGSKTFISNGMRADFYLTVVRTGGAGMGDLSVLLVEADAKGFNRSKLSKMGWHSSDTATLYFDDVEVPAENLVGAESGGLARILESFNGERLQTGQQCCAYARVCLDEALAWARERKTFGKRLGEHPVIRSKLADVRRHIEATQAWTDICAWRFNEGGCSASELALLKVQSTRMFEFVVREAAQILGGASYITGSKTERLYREVRVAAIGGGSEEILLDMAGRQMVGN